MHKVTPLQTQVETMLRDGFPEVEVLLVDRPSPNRVRIFIDRETSPVDTDLLEQVTRQLSPLREQYALEVSSPGSSARWSSLTTTSGSSAAPSPCGRSSHWTAAGRSRAC